MFYRIAQVMGEFNKESIKYQQNLFLNARKKPLPLIISDKSFIVGVTGFEPATFIAHKLTGTKGTIFSVKYIERFHEMEAALSNPDSYMISDPIARAKRMSRKKKLVRNSLQRTENS